MKFFNKCPISREEVINIITTKITQEITGTTIGCASTVCDDVADLQAVNHRIFISDGITTEEIAVGETITLAENVATKVKPIVSETNTFAFAIDVTGATDGQVFTYDEDTDTIIWKNLSDLVFDIGKTLFVSKEGVDATGLRESLNTHYLTISAALADSLEGDTIQVYPGTYEEGIINLDSLIDETNGYSKLTLNLIGNVIIDGSIVGTKYGLDILGKSATISSTEEVAINLTGTNSRETVIDLFRVQCGSINHCLKLDTFLGADVKIKYTNNVVTGGVQALGAVDIKNVETLKYQGESIYSYYSGDNYMVKLFNIGLLDFKVLKLTNSDFYKSIYIEQCSGYVTINYVKTGFQGFKIINSNLKLINSSIKGRDDTSNIIQIEGHIGLTSKVIFSSCHIEGETPTDENPPSPQTINLINIGIPTVGTSDYCNVKFEQTTITQINSDTNAGCIGISGDCAASHTNIWLQNCHQYSASEITYIAFDCGSSTFMGDDANVYYYGSNTSNGQVTAAGNTNFIGTLTSDTDFVSNIDLI
jgi:hypothetical protein